MHPMREELKDVYRAQQEANDILHLLQPGYEAICTECGLVKEIKIRQGMLAAHELRKDGWTSVGPVMNQSLLCPDCSVL